MFYNVCLILFLLLYYNVYVFLKVNEGKINDVFIFFLFIRIYDKNLGKKNKKNF